jgi:multicomponent Na+:H+ antiporter subunit A
MVLTFALIVAGLAPLVGWSAARWGRRWAGPLAALPALGLFVAFAARLPAISRGEVLAEAHPWVPSLDVQLSLRLDAWSLLFALLITGIGAAVHLYAGRYLDDHPQLGRFLAVLSSFMAAMLGLVLCDNLLALFVFWELTSITSYLLIGFEHRKEEARAAALKGLLVTVGGGQALLLGLLLLGQVAGTFELSELVGRKEAILAHPLWAAILPLVLLGAFTKSAQAPLHFWLPAAMAAPTPVSAYLHSATMVKAGIYLLARLEPAFGGDPGWTWALCATGALTMVSGAVLALRETDLKRVLAYATVSVLGTLTFLIGLGTPAALQAMAVYLLAHALYKGALFLVAGAVDHAAGSRDLTRLGGLRRSMPLTASAAVLAALAMAGLAPTFGYLGKELVYEAALATEGKALWGVVAAFTFSPLVAAAALLSVGLFFGQATAPRAPHEGSWEMVAPPLVLGALGLVLGLYPHAIGPWLGQLGGTGEGAQALKLSLWHGLTPALGLSVLTLGLGLALFGFRRALLEPWRRLPVEKVAASRAYDAALLGLKWLAATQTRLVQGGYLRRYVALTLAATGLTVGYGVLTRVELAPLANDSGVLPHEAVIAALVLVAAAAAATSKSRLAAVAAMGVVGLGVAGLFFLFGAPDLALTQALVEVLTVVVFALSLLHLPHYQELSRHRTRLRDGAIAVGFGAVMSALVLQVAGRREGATVAEYFLEHSVAQAHGRNVVNVILVDFRALDTLGEVTVLAAAAIGVVGLLRLRPTAPAREEERR